MNADGMITIEQAADLLNVSYAYMVELLENGKIPYTTMDLTKGNLHLKFRVVNYQDILAYKNRVDEQNRWVVNELTALSQDLNMGY